MTARIYNPSLGLYERLGDSYRDFPTSPGMVWQVGHEKTVEEISQRAMFTIKEPIYLSHVRWLGRPYMRMYTLVSIDEDGYIYGVILTYSSPAGLPFAFTLSQWYAGEDGYFEIETTNPIEKVMIGDIEALLVEYVIDDGGGILNPRIREADMIKRELFWMQDGIVFSISGYENVRTPFASIDLETLIAIAESIE